MLEAFMQLTSIDYMSMISAIIVFAASITALKIGMDKFFDTFEIIPPWKKAEKEETEYRKDVRNHPSYRAHHKSSRQPNTSGSRKKSPACGSCSRQAGHTCSSQPHRAPHRRHRGGPSKNTAAAQAVLSGARRSNTQVKQCSARKKLTLPT